MLRSRRVALSLLVVALSSAGCQRLFDGGEPLPTPTSIPTPVVPDRPSYSVEVGEVVRILEFSGRVSAVEEVSLHFRADGFAKSVFVERDQLVSEGQLLAELEIDDLVSAMAQAQVSFESAGLRLEEAEAALQREIAQAELDLLAANTRLERTIAANESAIADSQRAIQIAEAQLAKLRSNEVALAAEELAASIALAQAQAHFDRAQLEYQKAVDRTWEPAEALEPYTRALQEAEWNVQLGRARHNQTIAAQESHRIDLSIQELLIDQRQADLVRLELGVDPLLAIDEDRARQQLIRLMEGVDPVLINEVSQAQLALERLEAQVLDGQIIAPMGGQVLSISVRPGRAVSAFSPVITVADTGEVEVSANLTDEQMRELEEGREVEISFSSHPGRSWRGLVRRLPYPHGTGGGSQTLEGSDRSVRISLGDAPPDLDLGDLARVSVVLESAKDALWLPPEAVRSFQGRRFVVIQDGERQRRVDVRVGIEGENRIEIQEGLEAHMIVIGQ